MAIVNPTDDLHSLDFTQKIGVPNGLGHHVLGWSFVGHRDDRAGYYQHRNGRNGRIIVKMRPYWPTQNPGVAEQARRAKFRDGVTAWHNLTDSEKLSYNNMGSSYGQSGFTRFMSLYMRDLI